MASWLYSVFALQIGNAYRASEQRQILVILAARCRTNTNTIVLCPQEDRPKMGNALRLDKQAPPRVPINGDGFSTPYSTSHRISVLVGMLTSHHGLSTTTEIVTFPCKSGKKLVLEAINSNSLDRIAWPQRSPTTIHREQIKLWMFLKMIRSLCQQARLRFSV